MTKKKKIGKREVLALKPGEKVWDSTVPGFGARRQKSDAVSFVLFYRTGAGRQRWHTIGRFGAPWTVDEARDEAIRLRGGIVTGADPVAEKKAKRDAETVAELCDLYMADAMEGRVLKRDGNAKKASTLAIDRGRIERHIKPLMGSLPVGAVTREDVDRLLHDVAEGKSKAKIATKPRGVANVRGGKTAATRVVGLLGAIFTFAVRRGMRPDNPVHGAQRFSDAKRDRRLSDDEYTRLGAALRAANEQNIHPAAVCAIQFLALTGWRKGEALGLKWREVDLVSRTAKLGDTKTGRSIRPLSNTACDVLKGLSRAGELVFPPTKGNGVMGGFRRFWLKIAKTENLPAEITPHTLRHSFASLAADLGYSEPTIAALIGHQGRSVTSRYVHSADAVLLAAADVVADRTAKLMGDAKTGVVIPLHQRAG